MNTAAVGIVLAMLAQGGLALGLMWYLGSVRIPMILKGEVPIRDIATSRAGWPEREKRVSNAVDNQFQLPVLFYVACGLSLMMTPGWPQLVLAWLFVVTRYVHAAIHITHNNVLQRFWVFSAGLAVLTLFWLYQLLLLAAVALAGMRGAI